MKTKSVYAVILFVYAFLLSCELLACHLTHSLIILTDSYINLYKILDVALGILHLETQKHREKHNKKCTNNDEQSACCPTTTTTAAGKQEDELDKRKKVLSWSPAGQLFGRLCTYQFRRLPLLGAFVNGLFLAALLFSAAIEGIQTCFHANHLMNEKSILLAHPLTYPGLLCGFALVGLIMQYCTNKAHHMREEELLSESLLDVSGGQHSQTGNMLATAPQQLSVELLPARAEAMLSGGRPPLSHSSSPSFVTNRRATSSGSSSSSSSSSGKKQRFVLNSPAHRSFESVPTQVGEEAHISLRSLRITSTLGSQPTFLSLSMAVGSSVSSKDPETATGAGHVAGSGPSHGSMGDLWWPMVARHWTAPGALVACALIVYWVNNETITEVADATLSILVVVVLFVSSYPPMRKAGRVLLQVVPEGVEMEALRASLLSVSPLIVKIKELHVWSLTARSNRVATCKIVLDRRQVCSQRDVANLLQEIKFKFLDQSIKCSTVEPVFLTADNQESSMTTPTPTTTKSS